MNKATQRIYSARHVEAMTGVNQNAQRDWRRRGFLDGVGEREPPAGWWRYNARELELFRQLAAHRSYTEIVYAKIVADWWRTRAREKS